MQTPPKSTSESKTVECAELELPSLKRKRSVAFAESPASAPSEPAPSPFEAIVEQVVNSVAGQLADNFMERIVSALTTRRTSPRALLAIIDALHSLPHAKIPAPSNAREAHIRHMILMDKLLEATQKAHAKAKDAWERSPWERQHGANFMVLDGHAKAEETGEVIPDGCAICGVVKTECMKQDEHFGARGESPPDAKCAQCSKNFHNFYDSAHQLQLHVDEKHAEKQ